MVFFQKVFNEFMGLTAAKLQGFHLDQTSKLHIDLMPDDLSSKLGISIVKNVFHQGMLDYPGALSTVALDGDKVVGFCFSQIDFKAFAELQRKKFYFFLYLLRSLCLKPWLMKELFTANSYLNLEKKFVNIGPLLVLPEYRQKLIGDKKLPLFLTEYMFKKIAELANQLPVYTMIQPSNILSISAVSQGARKSSFQLEKKSKIFFRNNERNVYKYSFF